jgi:hypothetical protein
LTPIRNKIVNTGAYPELRGTGRKKNLIRAERDKFIIAEYKKSHRKKPFPIAEIKGKLIRKSEKDFSKDLARYKQYDCHDITIRRTLERYTKK